MGRTGWRESNFMVGEDLGDRLAEVSIARGWSIDTCVRKAMIAYARRRNVTLAGGSETRVRRRKPETLRDSDRAKITVTFPDEWLDGIAVLVDASVVHQHAAPLWREAVDIWVAAEVKAAARRAAAQAQKAQAA